MATFVLVAGAWHSAWCWERVAPLLESAGHKVLAPDLVGMGADRARFAEASLERWVAQLAELIEAQAEPVVLVGHSRGGAVISQTAERIPSRIARLIYLAAFLLEDGQSIVGVRRDGGEGLRSLLEPDALGGVRFPSSMVGQVFYNTTEPDWAARAAALLTPEPAAALAAPVRLTRERFGAVPRAYVECTEDRAVPYELQRAMQERTPCDRVMTLVSDHSPFYSDPPALADALLKLAA